MWLSSFVTLASRWTATGDRRTFSSVMLADITEPLAFSSDAYSSPPASRALGELLNARIQLAFGGAQSL